MEKGEVKEVELLNAEEHCTRSSNVTKQAKPACAVVRTRGSRGLSFMASMPFDFTGAVFYRALSRARKTSAGKVKRLLSERQKFYSTVFSRLLEAGAVRLPVPIGPSAVQRPRERNSERPRLDWAAHNERLTDREFCRLYRMCRASFVELVGRLRDRLSRDDDMGRRSSSGAISVELQLSMTLRFLAGGSYLDIAYFHGVHAATLFAAIWRVVEAIDETFHLEFPGDPESCERVAKGFCERFDNPLIGCVGAVDGLAIEIRRPPSSVCPKSRSFYNRKGFFAYVLQAACDHTYRFTFASCKCTGSTHDSAAFAVSSLGMRLNNYGLPPGFWIAGDEAYPAGPSLLTPWPGRDLSPSKDSFNYWLSSSRIHIEQSFGILVSRWGILWRALEVDYRKVPQLVMALLKLHNHCLARRTDEYGKLDRHTLDRRPGDALRLLRPESEPGRGRRRDREVCPLRTTMTDMLDHTGLLRPGRARTANVQAP